MTNNDILRTLRFVLNVNDKKLREILVSGGANPSLEDVECFLKDEEDVDYLRCDDLTMAQFMDGVIYFKRGKDESKPPAPYEIPITNNLILKKLRVAFKLKEEQMHVILEKANFPIGRAELTALLRKRDHPNYRVCGDQLLRYFMKGLAS